MGLTVTEEEKFYLEAWSISAEWFGKYPFPAMESKVLDEYQPMKSSRALIKRRLSGKREFTHNDLLHQDIGQLEHDVFDRIFAVLDEMYA